jgi:hypothetical protein
VDLKIQKQFPLFLTSFLVWGVNSLGNFLSGFPVLGVNSLGNIILRLSYEGMGASVWEDLW